MAQSRRGRKLRRRLGISLWTALAIAALVVGSGGLILVADFHRRTTASPLPVITLPAAVVFTGEHGRIELGLALLRAGQVDRLLVSGVNPRAGVRGATFADRYSLNAEERIALAEGSLIMLGLRAENTLENALESQCWHQTDQPENVVLITAPSHMPRASALLERMLPGVTVLRQPTRTDIRAERRWQKEFPRYLATRAILLFPDRWLWSWSQFRCDNGIIHGRVQGPSGS